MFRRSKSRRKKEERKFNEKRANYINIFSLLIYHIHSHEIQTTHKQSLPIKKRKEKAENIRFTQSVEYNKSIFYLRFCQPFRIGAEHFLSVQKSECFSENTRSIQSNSIPILFIHEKKTVISFQFEDENGNIKYTDIRRMEICS